MKLLKLKDVAERLNISKAQVHLLIKSGMIPAPVKNGQPLVWTSIEIDTLISVIATGVSDEARKVLCVRLVEERAKRMKIALFEALGEEIAIP